MASEQKMWLPDGTRSINVPVYVGEVEQAKERVRKVAVRLEDAEKQVLLLKQEMAVAENKLGRVLSAERKSGRAD